MPRSHRAVPSWLSRDAALVIVLALATIGVAWLCFEMLAPFVPSLTWALTLAVVGQPINRRFNKWVKRPGVAAALATLCVTLTIALPAVVAGVVIAREAIEASDAIRKLATQDWTSVLTQRHPTIAPAVQWVTEHFADGSAVQQLSDGAVKMVRKITAVSVYTVTSALITLFFLFYFFRDRRLLLDALPHFLPLSREESAEVGDEVQSTIEAMVYGTLVVSAIQGALGGLAFWVLGLPAPVLWGSVMAILSVLPLFGAALVWAPAALYLALTGEVKSAVMLAIWGAVVVGLVDNVVKPMLVRDRMHLHTMPVFIAVLGGLFVFGATGLVLGPVVLAVAMALLGIWRRRLAVQSGESGTRL